MASKTSRSPLSPSRAVTSNNLSSKRWATVASVPAAKEEAKSGAEESVFTVGLMVAAVGDGKILADGSRKTRDVLENISRFVSKEQSTTAVVGGQGKALEIKMRVFVQNSIEARAVSEYMAEHPNQKPAAFVLLIETLDMAVLYPSDELDPSSAAVADRLRKQAKTRAVRLVREAIACPNGGVTQDMLRGYAGPLGAVSSLEAFVSSRSLPMRGSLPGQTCISFHAKSRPQESSRPAEKPRSSSSCGSAPAKLSLASQMALSSRTQLGSSAATNLESDASEMSLFPVALFVTAIADGTVTRDTPQKAKERLNLIVSKIPKEQNTSVELKEGTQDLKMRVFVAGSEDAKAVSEYIQTHSNQTPSPFVILARELPMALLYDKNSLDLTDASVADRLRKQAKTRAVKLIREVIGESARSMGAKVLRGHSGAMAVSEVLAPLIAAKAKPVQGQPGNRKYIAFVAKTKGGPSPFTSPNLVATPRPPSPPLQPLDADDDERLCLTALRALARHSNSSNAENSTLRSRSTIPLGARWWDYVDSVHPIDHADQVRSLVVEQSKKNEDEDEAREGSPVHLASNGVSTSSSSCQGHVQAKAQARDPLMVDHATTLWHICRECNAENGIGSKSQTLGIHATATTHFNAAQAQTGSKRPREEGLGISDGGVASKALKSSGC